MIHGMFISINNYLLKFMQLKSMRLNLFIYGTDATLTVIKNCTYTNEARLHQYATTTMNPFQLLLKLNRD